MPLIRLSKVRESFGSLVVMDDLDFEVASGEKVAVIGPSGGGKSTLLRILMTLEKPDSGMVEIDGDLMWHMQSEGKLVPANTKHLRLVRSKIGMVFQHFNLFPHMTARENVSAAPIHVLNLPKRVAQERAIGLLEMVGLADKANSYPGQLSGGQQQRVAIARALAMRPKIILFDEVTSALDPELVGEVLSVIRKVAHDYDLTMVIVTHQMGFANEIADRVCFLENGRIEEQGSPETVLSSPRNERTRAFLKAVLEV
jgi:polar amino acid transport system ATP-binding protein